MQILKVLILVLFLVPPAIAETSSTIRVQGIGRVTEAPDLATITLGVTKESKTAIAAMDAVSAHTAQIIDQMKNMGIENRDMQTAQLSLNPQWSYYKKGGRDVREITGFVASNQLSVRVRDLDSLGQVLDGVLEVGANNFQGLRFGFAETAARMDTAREMAVKDAMRKAKLMAEAAGGSLGKIRSIEEAGGGQPRPVMMAEARMAADSAVPIAEGEVSLEARVTVVVELTE